MDLINKFDFDLNDAAVKLVQIWRVQMPLYLTCSKIDFHS